MGNAGWQLGNLKKEFPELATKKATNANERFKILDGLDAPHELALMNMLAMHWLIAILNGWKRL